MKKKNNHSSAAVIIQDRSPDNPNTNQEDSGIKACASDLLSAIKADDIDGIASAFKAAFDILEMKPHDEINHKENE